MARLSVSLKAAQTLPTSTANFQPRSETVDPLACNTDSPPLVTALWPDIAIELFAMRQKIDEEQTSVTVAEISELVARSKGQACVKILGLVTRAHANDNDNDLAKAQPDIDAAAELLDTCNDDKLRSEVANMQALAVLRTPFADTQFASAVRRAEASAARIPDDASLASVLQIKATAAAIGLHYDEAAALSMQAADLQKKRGLRAQQLRNLADAIDAWSVNQRGNQQRIVRELTAGSKLSEQLFGVANDVSQTFKRISAGIAWNNGKIDEARAITASLLPSKRIDSTPTQVVHGKVVDSNGKPVSGARVVADQRIFADALDIAPLSLPKEPNHTTSDSSGHFTITKAPLSGCIVAQSGTTRSRAVALSDNVTLRLLPTSSISGRIIASADPMPPVVVAVPSEPGDNLAFAIGSPVAADGSFHLQLVPAGRVRLIPQLQDRSGLGRGIVVTLTSEPMHDVTIELSDNNRTVYAVVHGTMMAQPIGGQVIIVDANASFKNAAELRAGLSSQTSISIANAKPVVGERVPKPLIGKVEPGQLVAELKSVTPGPHTACGLGLSGDVTKSEFWQRLEINLDRVPVVCVPLGAKQDTLTIEVPPLPRLD
jgi:hypothetical protein